MKRNGTKGKIKGDWVLAAIDAGSQPGPFSYPVKWPHEFILQGDHFHYLSILSVLLFKQDSEVQLRYIMCWSSRRTREGHSKLVKGIDSKDEQEWLLEPSRTCGGGPEGSREVGLRIRRAEGHRAWGQGCVLAEPSSCRKGKVKQVGERWVLQKLAEGLGQGTVTDSISLHWVLGLSDTASLVAQTVKNLHAIRETKVWSLGWEGPREKEMVTHSSSFAWEIPWTEEPGGL